MPSGFINLDKFLARHKKFIISTHESPDGDGLGAELAFNEILANMGKTTIILNSDPVPEKYLFIDPGKEIRVCAREIDLSDNIGEYAAFVLDTNDFSNIGVLHSLIRDRLKEVFIIDHHEGGQDKLESNFIKVEASSTCEIIYSLFRYYDMVPSFKAAQALYTGILFDTGSFRYPKTSPETFRAAARLVELGVNPFTVYEKIYESNTLSSFELESMILASMEIHFGGKMIALRLTPEMLRKSGASFSEGELSINIPLTVDGVIASILVKQDIEGPIKVSMRTKGDYDVARIAMSNGGGGHKNAAGYKSKLDFEETFRKVINEVGAFFRD